MVYPINVQIVDTYLGNSNPSEVEKVGILGNEKPQCQQAEILGHDHAVGFSTDILKTTQHNSFHNCAYCTGGLTQ